MSRGYSLVAVHRPLLAAAGFSFFRELALGRTGFSSYGLGSVVNGSQVLEHRLSGCRIQAVFEACGIFLDPGSNPRLLHWHVGSLPLSRQGSLSLH